ncbi:hypothetical protein JZ751_009774 [Albula glossodonta]|uniref:D-ribitol-5-phosphate cytidylyltransferase n=1 Tax=Albula glossodonta TaxID=121402 RepID=A0A8T2P6R6_9TELE|nr:hypothetical protein JZ751_009774 [Albula glossodonta]
MEADSNEQISGSCSIDFTVAVVLPAGGSGERTGLSTPKQFCTFLNRPLISYTIQAFERVGWIEHIVVVVAKDNLDLMVTIVQQFGHKKVKVVLGGSTRHRSIFNGLKAFEATGEECAPTKPKVVIIHDAVRPFVEEDFLVKIAVAAKEQGGYLDHSLERSKYRASEMPQGFLYDIIYQAYLQCSEADFEFGTECLHLALQYCGTNARLIEGPPTLWKTLSQTACVVTGVCEESVQLAHALQKTLGAQDMVHLDVSEQSPTGERTAVLGGVRDLATEAKQRNILLYGILLHHVKRLSNEWAQELGECNKPPSPYKNTQRAMFCHALSLLASTHGNVSRTAQLTSNSRLPSFCSYGSSVQILTALKTEKNDLTYFFS